MSSDHEEVSHMIVVGEDIPRVEESPDLEGEEPTMSSLRIDGEGSALQNQQLDWLWRLGQESPPRVLIMFVEKLKAESHS